MLHKYQMNNFNIVLDVNSGSIHSVDEVVYDILDYFETYTRGEIINILKTKYDQTSIEEGYDEIMELKANEVLFSPELSDKIISDVDEREPVVKALCLHVTHDCNLKCKYCFAGEGEYNGVRSLMSFEVGKKALEFLIKNSDKRRNLEVDFFGGEPLMNFEVIKRLVTFGNEQAKLNGKRFRFTITTNGMLLNDEIIDYINENMHNVVLSIDGRKEVNDAMRIRAGGQGSYDSIVPKFLKLAEIRQHKNYYVRGTFTRNNLDFAKDVIHLADLGFEQISVEPVVAEDSQEYSIQISDLPIIFDEYEKLAIEIIKRKEEGKGFNFFHFMIDITGGPCVVKRLVGCGAGTEYIAVTPEGDLYPCHQFVGNADFSMGNLFKGVNTLNIRQNFEKCNVYAKDECRVCWAKFYCSGGCASNAYNFNETILKPYEIGCELQRKRIECAIMIKVAEL